MSEEQVEKVEEGLTEKTIWEPRVEKGQWAISYYISDRGWQEKFTKGPTVFYESKEELQGTLPGYGERVVFPDTKKWYCCGWRTTRFPVWEEIEGDIREVGCLAIVILYEENGVWAQEDLKSFAKAEGKRIDAPPFGEKLDAVLRALVCVGAEIFAEDHEKERGRYIEVMERVSRAMDMRVSAKSPKASSEMKKSILDLAATLDEEALGFLPEEEGSRGNGKSVSWGLHPFFVTFMAGR